MSEKLYVNVFMTELGAFGHVISAKQYSHLKEMTEHGMVIYRDVEVHVVCSEDMDAYKIVPCFEAVVDIWLDGGKPDIAKIRAAVKNLAKQTLMR